MNEYLRTVKSAVAVSLTALGTTMGWKGAMLMTWVGVMALDYLSGTLAACREGKWSSKTARQGLWHKGGMILVVTVAAISDGVMVLLADHVPLGLHWPGMILPLVLSWYIITELGSILENAVKMGANVPGWIVNLMEAGLKMAEAAGESASELHT